MVPRRKTKKRRSPPSRAKSSEVVVPTSRSNGIDDILELEGALGIDEFELNVELAKHAELFYRVSKALALTISQRDAAKQALQDLEARVELDVREAAAQDDRKINNDEVRAMVVVDPQVRKARGALAYLSESVGALGALKEAFQQRSYALKDLSELYVANYYGASPENAGRRVSNRAGAEARKAMAEVRRRG